MIKDVFVLSRNINFRYHKDRSAHEVFSLESATDELTGRAETMDKMWKAVNGKRKLHPQIEMSWCA
jgi:hypothetical protein